ncbi:hypothetical protein E4T42_04456 [Aureobasidium subglaciale]|nr:hypothetical protein E4T42_04456 [Aureobasidium subglaciale]
MSHSLAVSLTVDSRKILATLPLRFRNLNLWQKACSILCQRHSQNDSLLFLIERFSDPCVSSASVNKEKQKSSTPSKWKSYTKSNYLSLDKAYTLGRRARQSIDPKMCTWNAVHYSCGHDSKQLDHACRWAAYAECKMVRRFGNHLRMRRSCPNCSGRVAAWCRQC